MLGGYQRPGTQFGPHGPRYRVDNGASRPHPFYMLVIGPQGCGKSSFVNQAIGRPDCITSADAKLCTQSFQFCKWSRRMNGYEFRFTDTPGFGNEAIDDKRILEMLIENFVPNTYGDRLGGPNLPQIRKVTGLIYIHSEEEPLRSRTSRKTIEMLVNVLGEQFLNRVTVLVRPTVKPPFEPPFDLSNFMPHTDSPLYPLYCNNTKPWTMSYEGDPHFMERVLGPYTTLHPRVVRLAALDNFVKRYGGNWSYNDISCYSKEFLAGDVGPPPRMDQPASGIRLQEMENELGRLQTLLGQKEQDMKNLQATHEVHLNNIQTERLRETFNHDVGVKRLHNAVQEQDIKISNLISELERLEAFKNEEIGKLSSQKDSEIKELRDKLRAKEEELMTLEKSNEEISKFSVEKDSKMELLREKMGEKEEELISLKADYDRRIQQAMDVAQTKGNEVAQSKTKVDGTIAKTERKYEDEIDCLNEEIRRINTEYASLRNHMQLEENTEQADITTALGDINRLIEEFGGSLSEHIEKHMEQSSSQKALQPQDLLALFGQLVNKTVPKGKQDAYVLFEYAVQATICDQLYTHLFKPFHPSIADDEKRSAFITRLYEQMTRQEVQSVAGRWRKDTFNSISRDLSPKSQENPNDQRMHRIVNAALSTLLGKLINIQPDEVLKGHERALFKILVKAEELNQLLKGGISMLGDFQPISFPFGEAFQPDYMSEITSKPKKPNNPERILGTIELGLVKRNALGGGRKTDEKVLRKTMVFGLPQ